MVYSILSIFQQVPLTTLVPNWFYIFSGLAYLIVALIGFAISYFSFRISRTTSSKQHLILSVAFLLIGVAFASLFAVSIYTYQNASAFISQTLLNLNDNVYDIY